jgi:phospholipase A1
MAKLSCRFLVLVFGLSGLLPTSVLAESATECVYQAIKQAKEGETFNQVFERCNAQGLASDLKADLRYRDCVYQAIEYSEKDADIGAIKTLCDGLANASEEIPDRMIQEKISERNPYIITPHKKNYILPFSYMKDPNQAPYKAGNVYPDLEEPIENAEIKLQISLKVPLTYESLILDNDGLYFGFTLKSFWQLYNKDISSPFRETNYQPEIFYTALLPYRVMGLPLVTGVGLEHESNGRTQYLSRSWNRAYVMLAVAEDNWGLSIRPWYRFDEDAKVDDGDPTTPPPSEGDDNPDITDYIGHYEINGAYRLDNVEFTGMFRRNFREGHGAFEVDVSFPLWGRLRGFAQYYNGYGESLIDYNYKMERIGVGILLTGLL